MQIPDVWLVTGVINPEAVPIHQKREAVVHFFASLTWPLCPAKEKFLINSSGLLIV